MASVLTAQRSRQDQDASNSLSSCKRLFSRRRTILFNCSLFFIPYSHLEPSLVNVSYTIYDTTGSTLCSNCTPSNPCLYAWTKRSMYQYFHPAVVHQLQFLLPFALMRLTDSSLPAHEPDAYLWDGIGSLPSVRLNLTVNSSSLSSDVQQYLQNCTPEAMDTVQNALREVTIWVCYSIIQFCSHVLLLHTAQGIC